MPVDRISGHRNYGSPNVNLKNLLPYFKRHWGRGLIRCLFIVAATLFAFPPPIITHFLGFHLLKLMSMRIAPGIV